MRKQYLELAFKIRGRDDSSNKIHLDGKMYLLMTFLRIKSQFYFLPGAFTRHAPPNSCPLLKSLKKFKALGIDEIFCLSVNDSGVMNAWSKSLNLNNVKVIPDGSENLLE